MLTNTFIHIQGIGVKTEQKFWGSGLTDWSRLSPESINGRPSRSTPPTNDSPEA